MRNQPAGWIVRHQNEKGNWRLRNVTGLHPIDPNWETGRYCKCHERLRLNPNVKNTVIFDAIWISGKKYPFVRSAFKVKFVKDEMLHFDSYYFADVDPIEITPEIIPTMKPNLHRTNPGKKLDKKDCQRLLKEIKKSYQKYKKGMKPRSISWSDWKRMKDAAEKSMHKRHKCHFDRKSFIPLVSLIS